MPQFNHLGAYAFNAIRPAALSVFLFAAILLLLGTVSSSAQQRETSGGLVGASSNNFPPVNILDSDGELTGFGRELSDAVLKAVGAKATHIHSGQWTKVLEMLDSGEADFIHDTGYTVERTSFLDYTDPILEMPERIFVLDSRFDITSFADLVGKRVACVDQHITHLYLKQFPEITCHIVKRPVEGLNALAEGTADAFIYPKQIGLYMSLGIGMRDRVKMVGEPLRTLTWHMTVKKGNTPVVDLLNQGLAKVRADGTYDRIYSKWFGEPLLAGFSKREVFYLVAAAIMLSLLAAGTVFALLLALRMRRARDALALAATERERAEAMLGEKEQRHAGVLDIAQEAIITIGADHRIETFNQGAENIFGYSAGEVLGQHLDMLIPPQFRAAHDTHVEKFSREPVSSRLMINRGELSGLRKDGTEFPAEASISKLRVDGKNVFSVVLRDITERKRIEEGMREREELYRVTFELAGVGVAHVSPDGRILRANQKLCEILGYDSDEILRLSHRDVTVPDDKAKDEELTNQLLAGERSSYSREKRYFRKDGSTIWGGLTVALVRDASGEPDYFISIIEDITERKELEANLQRSAMAIDSAAEMITLFDADDRLIQYNQTFLDSYPELKNLPSLDLTFEEILRTIFATGTKAEAEGHLEEWIAERMERHRNPGAPFEVALKGGRWILVSVHRLPDGGTVSIASDITELKQTEEAVRNNEQRLNAIFNQHRDAIVIVDGEGLIRFANTAAERILGRRAEDLIDKPFGIPLAGGDIVEVEIAARDIRIAEMQATPFDWEGSEARLVTLRDVTERKQAESNTQQLRSQLAHAARLSTVGDLAAGLAHEINQPLTAINNYIQASVRLLRSDTVRAGDVIEDLEKAGRQVLRAGDIVTWLRGAVRKEEGERTELDLIATIEEVADFIEAEIRAKNAEVKLEFPTPLPPVLGDKVQIQQVVLNLIQNSLEEAMGGQSTKHEIIIRAWETPEGMVLTEVSDSGPGVPRDRQNDLFSAFFTTKADGLGLGLSISKTIIEDHGGRIWLVTESGQGATFAFTLHIAKGAASAAAPMAQASD